MHIGDRRRLCDRCDFQLRHDVVIVASAAATVELVAVSRTTSFIPSERPALRPPSRYAAPDATYFTRNAVRKSGWVARNAKAEGISGSIAFAIVLVPGAAFSAEPDLGDEVTIPPKADPAPTDLPSSPQAPLPSHWQTPKSR